MAATPFSFRIGEEVARIETAATTYSWPTGTTGENSSPDHGVCRLVVSKLYFWKSASVFALSSSSTSTLPGFWEVNGYHPRSDLWKEERYSDQETDAMQRIRAESARRRRRR